MKRIIILLTIGLLSLSFKANDRNFLIVFGKPQTKDSLDSFVSRIKMSGEITIIKYCDVKNAFMCTIDGFKYPTLTSIDREVHNPAYNLPKCYIKQLEPNEDCN